MRKHLDEAIGKVLVSADKGKVIAEEDVLLEPDPSI